MINICAIDHVVLRTSKLEAMVHFYQTVLNCQVERTLPDEVGLVQLRAGNALIDIVPVDSQLGRLGGKPPSQDGRNIDHVCFQISSFDEEQLIAYLDQHQVSYSDFAERYGAQGFGRSIYIDDPEGNVIELKPVKPQ